jgi:hypothetical protein
MPKKESPYSQAMKDDAKNGYILLINQMKMDGRSEDYIKKFIDGMKASDAKRCERESAEKERARHN